MVFRAIAGCVLGLVATAALSTADADELKLGYSLAPTSHYGASSSAMAVAPTP